MNLSHTLEMSDRPLVRSLPLDLAISVMATFSMASSVVDLECTQLHLRQT